MSDTYLCVLWVLSKVTASSLVKFYSRGTVRIFSQDSCASTCCINSVISVCSELGNGSVAYL